MCNKKHTDKKSKVKSIPESGTGWKIFDVTDKELKTLTNFRKYDRVDRTVKWIDKFRFDGDGFCFFENKNDAVCARIAWDKAIGNDWSNKRKTAVKEISYSGGIESHIEDRFITNELFRVALCKEFTLQESFTQRGEFNE